MTQHREITQPTPPHPLLTALGVLFLIGAAFCVLGIMLSFLMLDAASLLGGILSLIAWLALAALCLRRHRLFPEQLRPLSVTTLWLIVFGTFFLTVLFG